jgi:nitroreductase
MNLTEIIQTNNTCRFYRDEDVSNEHIESIVSAARFGPSGGNRQPVSFIVVRDKTVKDKMQALYLPFWNTYTEAINEGMVKLGTKDKRIVTAADHFARHLAEIPVFLIVCARLADCHATDTELDRLSIVGGASIYPAVQNMLLAARDIGLGTALTTLLCHVEPEIKSLLNIPDDVSTAAMVTVGWPEKPFPSKLQRVPVSEMTWSETYGNAFITE